MDVNLNDLVVVNNEAAGQYEARVGAYVSILAYQRQGAQIIFTHTEVPQELEGHGIAGKLAKTALDEARTQGWTVVPMCPYLSSYLRRHQEYLDIVAPAFRRQLTRAKP